MKWKSAFTVLGFVCVLLSLTFLHPADAAPSQSTSFPQKGPRTEDVYIYFYADLEESYEALKAGEIDIAWTQYEDAINDPNILLAPLSSYHFYEFDFNNNDTIPSYPNVLSPMTYLSFRQALAFLVDKEYLINVVWGGHAERTDVPIPYRYRGWWNESVVYPNYPYEYDPIAAKSLLDAKFPEGITPNPYYDREFPGSARYVRTYPTDHPQKPGRDLNPVIFCLRSDIQKRLFAGRYLYENMRKHGIPVDPVEAGWSTLWPRVYRKRDYHIYTDVGAAGRYPPLSMFYYFHSKYWDPRWGLNNVLPPGKYPSLDDELEKAYYATSLEEAMFHCKNAQGIFVDNAISIWLLSHRYYSAYRKGLMGVVNRDDFGILNMYTFMNAYHLDGSPIRIGYSPPGSMNVVWPDVLSWPYNMVLNRIYESNEPSVAPYALEVDQPWAVQDWHFGEWFDEEVNSTKTKVTYWFRKDIFWVKPVTGEIDYQFTAHDYVFSMWFMMSQWQYTMDIHHVKTVDDFAVEIYMDTRISSLLLAHWGPTIPIIPKTLWIEKFCKMRKTTLTLYKDYQPGERLKFTDGRMNFPVQIINVTLDDAPLTEGVDYQTVAKKMGFTERIPNWIQWKRPVYAGQKLTTWYWTPHNKPSPKGYTPGDYPWDQILEGCGMYYITDFVPGAGGYVAFKANRFYFLETPQLGEIDWRWRWGARNESRRIDSERAPRTGSYQIDINDVILAIEAFSSTGDGVPDLHWFPGADLSAPSGVIDGHDILTVIGGLLESMNLQQGIKKSLHVKLADALSSLEAQNDGKRNDAANKLHSFINEVKALKGKKITETQADQLIAAAQVIIDLIRRK